jgi:hypothetical protein
MTDHTPTRRRFFPTPAWLVLALLVLEGLLWLSERYRWFWFNEKKGWTVLIGVVSVGVAMLVMLLWWIVALVFRWRFQFSIRSLLVLVVVVAVPFSWLAVKMRQASRQREAVQEVVKLGGWVWYDWEGDVSGEPLQDPNAPCSKWLRELLGDNFFGSVYGLGTGKGSDAVGDDAMVRLRELPEVKLLYFPGYSSGDAGLDNLSGLTRLQELTLDDGNITDAGLKRIGALSQLQKLSLFSTPITDAGLEHLRGLTQLKKLSLDRTDVTDEGVQNLQQALPYCEIDH